MNRTLLTLVAVAGMLGCSGTIDLGSSDNPSASYVDNSYLADPLWLKDNLNQSHILIIDTRPQADYSNGHIPGAISVRWQDFADMTGSPNEPGYATVLPPAQLSVKLASIGVDESKTIIVCGDAFSGWGEDGRMVWVLRLAGLSRSMILNGGFSYWKDQGFTEEQGENTPVPTTYSFQTPDSQYLATTEYVRANAGSIVIFDTRTEDEYNGSVNNYGEARTGHIPGAVHLEFNSVYNQSGLLKSQSELETLFGSNGVNASEVVVVSYCTGGIRSAFLTIVLRLAGYSQAKNYDASFWEWAAIDSLAVRTPATDLAFVYDNTDSLLDKYVTSDRGLVDYTGIYADPLLEVVRDNIAEFDLSTVNSSTDSLAFWINAYNIMVIYHLRDFPWAPQDQQGFPLFSTPITVAGERLTLDQLEKETLPDGTSRIKMFGEPRTHFALVCAAMSCPPLLNRAYRGDSLFRQLDERTGLFLNNDELNPILSPGGPTVSPLFQWYAVDFVGFARDTTLESLISSGGAGNAGDFIAGYLSDTTERQIILGNPLSYADYDWSINEQP